MRGFKRAHGVQISETPRLSAVHLRIGTPVSALSDGGAEGGGSPMIMSPSKRESSGHGRIGSAMGAKRVVFDGTGILGGVISNNIPGNLLEAL